MVTARKQIPPYTAVDYAQWQGDWELWEGMPVEVTPSPFGRHQQILSRLIAMLSNQVETCPCACDVLPELDWIVSENSIVRPDLMVVCGGIPQRHLTSPPVLIAEILSPSTAQRDRQAKFALYESQRVPHYLLVDPDRHRIDVFSLSPAGRYETVPFSECIPLVIQPDCRIEISTGRLFR